MMYGQINISLEGSKSEYSGHISIPYELEQFDASIVGPEVYY